MTIINALNKLKAAGITRLVGMSNTTDIDAYIAHANKSHALAVQYAPEVNSWQHTLDHENDNRMITTEDGHHIIATKYSTFEMATYSDYDTEEEMRNAFEEIEIAEKAEAIANDMDATRPMELLHNAWVLIATAELKAAYKASSAAFEREYGRY